MENQVLLSFLIPVYNAECFIRRCLDSIVGQLCSDSNVEIVVINDGSKDSSLDILTQYSDRYACIKLISRENRGIGPTRNELIQNASGDYFWFVDADDFIADNALQVIMPLLKCGDYDMLMTSYYWGNETSGRIVKYSGEYASALEMTDNLVFNNSLWTRIYRTSVVKEGCISFGRFVMGEDFDFILKLTPLLHRVRCIEDSLYNYIFNPKSAVGNADTVHRRRVSDDSVRCIVDNVNYIADRPSEQQAALKKHLDSFTAGYILSLYSIDLNLSEKLVQLNVLRTCGALPICSNRSDWKHWLFTAIVNNRFLCYVSFVLDRIYLLVRS